MEHFPTLSIGAAISSTGLTDNEDILEDDIPFETLIGVYKNQLAELNALSCDFYLGSGFSSLAEARAFVIAARETGVRTIMISFPVDENGETFTGSDILAVLTIMQGMGVSVFGIECESPSLLPDFLNRVVHYSKIPLMTTVPGNISIEDLRELSGVLVIKSGDPADTGRLMDKIAQISGMGDYYDPLAKYDDTTLIAADSRAAYFIEPTIDIVADIRCTPDFIEDILASEDEVWGALRVIINSESDLSMFEKNQFILNRPVCIYSDNSDILEKAVRIYNGRAIFDHACDISEEQLLKMASLYGLLIL